MQVAVREQHSFQSDGNNVRRAEHGKTSPVKLLVSGFMGNLAKFPSGLNFFFFFSKALTSLPLFNLQFCA